MSDLVGNPEGKVSHDAAHLKVDLRLFQESRATVSDSVQINEPLHYKINELTKCRLRAARGSGCYIAMLAKGIV